MFRLVSQKKATDEDQTLYSSQSKHFKLRRLMKGAENEREQKVAVRQHTTGRAINPRVSGWPTLKSRANIDTKTDPLHPLRYLFLFALLFFYFFKIISRQFVFVTVSPFFLRCARVQLPFNDCDDQLLIYHCNSRL